MGPCSSPIRDSTLPTFLTLMHLAVKQGYSMPSCVLGLSSGHPHRTVPATRVWTLQEGILARRMIFFTGDSMVRRCSEVCCDEFQRFHKRWDPKFAVPGLQKPDGSDRFWAWMVENHSRRRLTRSKDKNVHFKVSLISMKRGLMRRPLNLACGPNDCCATRHGDWRIDVA